MQLWEWIGVAPDGVGPDRQELLGALTLAIDLGLAEHVLRSAICAHRLAGALGLDADQQRSAFHTTMVMWIGCHADSHEYGRWLGDDIAARRNSYR